MKRSNSQTRSLFSALVIALFAGMFCASDAAAHALPERTSPPIEGAVPIAPDLVEVWFTEEVEPEGTSLTVLMLDGTQVDRGNTAVDEQDPERRHVTIGLHDELGNGVYVVQWTTLSAVDGATVSGSYQFTVDPGASPEPIPQLAPSGDDSRRIEIDAPSKDDPNYILYGILGIVGLLAVLGAVAYFFLWRGRDRDDDTVLDRL